VSSIVDQLRDYALAFPEAWEDFPWGDRVVKVRRKVFVFLGKAGDPKSASLCVKLRASQQHALSWSGTHPGGYGLGKSGWVEVPLRGKRPPVDLLRDWIAESYCLVAPAKLVAQLSSRDAE
jgi:predicted DNA-binding protein (MmcQ/YjbR family)